MREVFKELKKQEVKDMYKVLIVDTVDLAAKYCTKYISAQLGVSDLSEVPYGKAYQAMRNEFEDVFNSLAQMGYAVFFISHAQIKTITRSDGTEYNKICPSLSPDKVNDIIKNMADIYGYAHWKRSEDGTMSRVLTLISDDEIIDCGCRFGNIQHDIPLGYDTLVEALNEAIDEIQERGGEVTDEPIQPIMKETLDYNELMATFDEIVTKLQEVSGGSFGVKHAPNISAIIGKYLGKGRKISDTTPEQVEQVALIVSDLIEYVGNGV